MNRVIVVGGSAGAVEPLKAMLAALPPDLDAAVFIVVHVPPSSPGRLADILQRRSALPVAWANDGESIEPGRVYIAPPDRHLVVDRGCVRLTRGPRENHSRPAIDPLFRSAALTFGPRAIAVLLSGRLDDGTAGLWAVKDRGGITVVQAPDDAMHPDMPRNALEHTAADHLVPAAAIGPLLVQLSAEPRAADVELPVSPALELEVQIAMEANALENGVMSIGPTTPYTCPDCHGVLMRVPQEGIPRFRCHTGHAFAIDSLLASTTESVEETLWSALRAMEETVLLLREAAIRPSVAHGGDRRPDSRFEQKAREAEARASLIREAILRHQSLSLEVVRESGAAGWHEDVGRSSRARGAARAD